MDSLPTGSTQSWLIVATVAFSPAIVLFFADAVRWLIRQAMGTGGVTTVGQDAAGCSNEQCSDWDGGEEKGLERSAVRGFTNLIAN